MFDFSELKTDFSLVSLTFDSSESQEVRLKVRNKIMTRVVFINISRIDDNYK